MKLTFESKQTVPYAEYVEYIMYTLGLLMDYIHVFPATSLGIESTHFQYIRFCNKVIYKMRKIMRIMFKNFRITNLKK